jgi:hypothetical protein
VKVLFNFFFLIFIVLEYQKFMITQFQFWDSMNYIGFLGAFFTLQLGLVRGNMTLITHWRCEQKMPTGFSLSLNWSLGTSKFAWAHRYEAGKTDRNELYFLCMTRVPSGRNGFFFAVPYFSRTTFYINGFVFWNSLVLLLGDSSLEFRPSWKISRPQVCCFVP